MSPFRLGQTEVDRILNSEQFFPSVNMLLFVSADFPPEDAKICRS